MNVEYQKTTNMTTREEYIDNMAEVIADYAQESLNDTIMWQMHGEYDHPELFDLDDEDGLMFAHKELYQRVINKLSERG